MATNAQINANLSNCRLSTGPKTEEGKAKSSQNAVKTALTGQTILLASDDVAEYEKIGQIFIAQHKPATYEEEVLVQCVIDTEWRLMRIPVLEEGIYAVGRLELADTAPVHLLQTQVYLKYERQFKNLSLQENRLRRNREKDLARLKALQTERHEKEATTKKLEEMRKQQQPQPKPEPTVPTSAIALFNEAKQAAAINPAIDISGIGFEFSKEEVA
jgi:hypothetical protein